MRKVELLSPAKNKDIGIAAINNGADAVYIGCSQFGARHSASNSIRDIAELTKYAHKYYACVFVTMNTILHDNELKDAERMIWQLYDVGIDALIVQDMGVLEMNLPPIALHASTQTHNYDLDRIKFLEDIGFTRIVLARELSLEQIRRIRDEVKVELEMFVHGALCVSLSGQCYMSNYISGRSANRGECSQSCRQRWNVEDSTGKILVKDKHILSLKDLNLSAYINEIIDIGVDSLKIEGRLKDISYVSNITQHYSNIINKANNIVRCSSGNVYSDYTPDPEVSFNRGFTDYFVSSRKTDMVNMITPKSVGKFIGTVSEVKNKRMIKLRTNHKLSNGDGFCYIKSNKLFGVRLNNINNGFLELVGDNISLSKGDKIYRNNDKSFNDKLVKSKTTRKIDVSIIINIDENKINIGVKDENGVGVSCYYDNTYDLAKNEEQKDRIISQICKTGDTEFRVDKCTYKGVIIFIPASSINEYKRDLFDKLRNKREEDRPLLSPSEINQDAKYLDVVDNKHNVINSNAERFYLKHGASKVDKGIDVYASLEQSIELMKTKYCILYELGRCTKHNKNTDIKQPLFLSGGGNRFRLEFDCPSCFMKIVSK